jgi:hypothetical protein
VWKKPQGGSREDPSCRALPFQELSSWVSLASSDRFDSTGFGRKGALVSCSLTRKGANETRCRSRRVATIRKNKRAVSPEGTGSSATVNRGPRRSRFLHGPARSCVPRPNSRLQHHLAQCSVPRPVSPRFEGEEDEFGLPTCSLVRRPGRVCSRQTPRPPPSSPETASRLHLCGAPPVSSGCLEKGDPGLPVRCSAPAHRRSARSDADLSVFSRCRGGVR